MIMAVRVRMLMLMGVLVVGVVTMSVVVRKVMIACGVTCVLHGGVRPWFMM